MKTNISKLKSTLESIGKCEFRYDISIKDYSFNSKDIKNFEEDYYLKLKESFNEKMALQLVNQKVDEKLLLELITKTQGLFYHVKERKGYLRVNYLLGKRHNKLRESADWTHKGITALMIAQMKTLNDLNTFLIRLLEEFKYLIPEDLENFKSNNKIVPEADKIEIHHYGKITVKLTKKDTISLFLMLENIGVLDFKETDRNKFIEQNFTYNHSNGKVLPMKDINSDISNLKDIKTYKSRNTNSFRRLNDKLIKLIESFDFNTFATKLR
jgi:hypothetical protein